MIYIVYSFGVFIILAIIVVIWQAKQFYDLKWVTHNLFANMRLPIIERAYRSMDFVSSVRYIREEALMRYGHMVDTDREIIVDSKHRDYIIRDCVNSLANEMLKNGVVEVRDSRDDPEYYGNPYEGTLTMRIKAYKPDHVI